MCGSDTIHASKRDFFRAMLDHDLLFETGTAGIFARGHIYEDIIRRIKKLLVSRCTDPSLVHLRFPPLMPMDTLQQTDFLSAMPHLAGAVHSFCGNHEDHAQLIEKLGKGQDWQSLREGTDIVVTPAACLPLYPIVATWPLVPAEGYKVALDSYCFRREPSEDPFRMQSFQQFEFVSIHPSALRARQWRNEWSTRAKSILHTIGLDTILQPATDPFFGRWDKVLSQAQIDKNAKIELCFKRSDTEPHCALASFNAHDDTFSKPFSIRTEEGGFASTSCAAFGLDRVAMAMLSTHGLNPTRWPRKIRQALWRDERSEANT